MKFFNVLLTTTLALSSCAVLAQLTEHQPKILFDGSELETDETNHQIYVMDPDGSHVQPLTENPPGTISYNAFAAWSPDRQKIAFNSTHDGDYEIYVMAADGSDVQRLTRYRGLDGYPAWSPDGHQISFARDTDPPATGPLWPTMARPPRRVREICFRSSSKRVAIPQHSCASVGSMRCPTRV